jgi:hypothetical protein
LSASRRSWPPVRLAAKIAQRTAEDGGSPEFEDIGYAEIAEVMELTTKAVRVVA